MVLGKKIFHCHQLPDRSFFFHGMQFPVCARCTGILLGFFLLAPIITVFTLGSMKLSLMLIFMMVYDGTLQFCTVYNSNNVMRLLTGAGFGYGCFSLIVHAIVKFVLLF